MESFYTPVDPQPKIMKVNLSEWNLKPSEKQKDVGTCRCPLFYDGG